MRGVLQFYYAKQGNMSACRGFHPAKFPGFIACY
jgi:hypothetical protein